jgi:hypothetical protein
MIQNTFPPAVVGYLGSDVTGENVSGLFAGAEAARVRIVLKIYHRGHRGKAEKNLGKIEA